MKLAGLHVALRLDVLMMEAADRFGNASTARLHGGDFPGRASSINLAESDRLHARRARTSTCFVLFA